MDPDSYLGRRGLQPGVRLIRLNGEPMNTREDFARQVPLLLDRRAATMEIAVRRTLYRVSVPIG
ncbi:MAG: hypothetical protein JSV80_13610 [Acidobacteriota bacterium]|nr:MAG: hypothetical protein JSV80_13610 [Acidobacteriota bacterium]